MPGAHRRHDRRIRPPGRALPVRERRRAGRWEGDRRADFRRGSCRPSCRVGPRDSLSGHDRDLPQPCPSSARSRSPGSPVATPVRPTTTSSTPTTRSQTIIAANPTSILAVDMPHATPEGRQANLGFFDAPPEALPRLEKLKADGPVRQGRGRGPALPDHHPGRPLVRGLGDGVDRRDLRRGRQTRPRHPQRRGLHRQGQGADGPDRRARPPDQQPCCCCSPTAAPTSSPSSSPGPTAASRTPSTSTSSARSTRSG